MGCCADDKKKCCGIGFHSIPAALGDDTGEFKPENGAYHNMLVKYEENGAIYLYTNDGVPIKISGAEAVQEDAVRLRVEWDGGGYPEGWINMDDNQGARIDLFSGTANIIRFWIPNEHIRFIDESTGMALNTSQTFSLAESGKKVILDHVPLGAYYPYSDDTIFSNTTVDNVELSAYVSDAPAESPLIKSYTGGAFVPCAEAVTSTYMGVQVSKVMSDEPEYVFCVSGRSKFYSDTAPI